MNASAGRPSLCGDIGIGGISHRHGSHNLNGSGRFLRRVNSHRLGSHRCQVAKAGPRTFHRRVSVKHRAIQGANAVGRHDVFRAAEGTDCFTNSELLIRRKNRAGFVRHRHGMGYLGSRRISLYSRFLLRQESYISHRKNHRHYRKGLEQASHNKNPLFFLTAHTVFKLHAISQHEHISPLSLFLCTLTHLS